MLPFNNRPTYEALGNNFRVCAFIPLRPRADVYCVRLSFNINRKRSIDAVLKGLFKTIVVFSLIVKDKHIINNCDRKLVVRVISVLRTGRILRERYVMNGCLFWAHPRCKNL